MGTKRKLVFAVGALRRTGLLSIVPPIFFQPKKSGSLVRHKPLACYMWRKEIIDVHLRFTRKKMLPPEIQRLILSFLPAHGATSVLLQANRERMRLRLAETISLHCYQLGKNIPRLGDSDYGDSANPCTLHFGYVRRGQLVCRHYPNGSASRGPFSTCHTSGRLMTISSIRRWSDLLWRTRICICPGPVIETISRDPSCFK